MIHMNETGVGERKSIPNVDELHSTKKKTKVRKNCTQTPLQGSSAVGDHPAVNGYA